MCLGGLFVVSTARSDYFPMPTFPLAPPVLPTNISATNLHHLLHTITITIYKTTTSVHFLEQQLENNMPSPWMTSKSAMSSVLFVSHPSPSLILFFPSTCSHLFSPHCFSFLCATLPTVEPNAKGILFTRTRLFHKPCLIHFHPMELHRSRIKRWFFLSLLSFFSVLPRPARSMVTQHYKFISYATPGGPTLYIPVMSKYKEPCP